MKSRKSLLDILGSIFNILASIAVIFGVGYGYLQYEETKTNNKRETAINLLNRYSSGDFIGIRNQIAEIDNKLRIQVKSLKSSEKFEQEKMKIINEYPGLKESLKDYLNFFEELGVMVDMKLADEKICQYYFGELVTVEYNYYKSFIKEIQKKNRDAYCYFEKLIERWSGAK